MSLFDLGRYMEEIGFFDPKPVPGYSDVLVDREGNTFRPDGSELHQFNSNGYKQICAHSDETGKRRVIGVHQLVAMTYMSDEYYPGCVVHHIDENKSHNCIGNLRVESVPEHSRHHANPEALLKHLKEHGPHNKGKKMSDEFREHCRISALKRAERERQDGINRGKGPGGCYRGNQFRDADGNPKKVDPEAYARFREACRKAALKREEKKRLEKLKNK